MLYFFVLGGHFIARLYFFYLLADALIEKAVLKGGIKLMKLQGQGWLFEELVDLKNIFVYLCYLVFGTYSLKNHRCFSQKEDSILIIALRFVYPTKAHEVDTFAT